MPGCIATIVVIQRSRYVVVIGDADEHSGGRKDEVETMERKT